jgi:cyclase
VNTAVVNHPDLIWEIANRFGSQCVVVSIDARKDGHAEYEAYIESGTQPTGLGPVSLAQRAESLGAGEILITSVDRDGTMQGYDIDLISQVTKAVSIPVIASGGAGSYAHMAEALRAGASALAAASMFHFTEQTPREAKLYLREHGFPTRI